MVSSVISADIVLPLTTEGVEGCGVLVGFGCGDELPPGYWTVMHDVPAAANVIDNNKSIFITELLSMTGFRFRVECLRTVAHFVPVPGQPQALGHAAERW